MRRAAVIRPVGPPAAQAASSNSHVPAPACTGCLQAGPPHQALQCGAVPAAREGRPAPGTQQQQRHGSASIGGGSGGGSVLALNVRPALPALHNQWVTCSAIPACLTSLRRLCCLPACLLACLPAGCRLFRRQQPGGPGGAACCTAEGTRGHGGLAGDRWVCCPLEVEAEAQLQQAAHPCALMARVECRQLRDSPVINQYCLPFCPSPRPRQPQVAVPDATPQTLLPLPQPQPQPQHRV